MRDIAFARITRAEDQAALVARIRAMLTERQDYLALTKQVADSIFAAQIACDGLKEWPHSELARRIARAQEEANQRNSRAFHDLLAAKKTICDLFDISTADLTWLLAGAEA